METSITKFLMPLFTIIGIYGVSTLVFGVPSTPLSNSSVGNQNLSDSQNIQIEKHWYAALGPVISNALVGTNGTKYSIALGYDLGLSEHWDLLYFYQGNFNTGSQGSTPVTEIGVAAKTYFNDRLAEITLFLKADVGYGGGNRSNDANAIFGGSAGVDFFRTKEATFEVAIREFVQAVSSGGSPQSWPSATEIMFGLMF